MSKFLIIRLSSIGDIILTSPVVRCLKQQIPGAEVHFITKKQYQPLVEANPYIDKVYCLNDDLSTIIPQLKEENYDLIIDLHKNFRSGKIRTKLHKKYSTFNKINVRKWLMVNFKLKVLPNVHIVDRYFEAVEGIGVKNDQIGLDYFIPEKDEVKQESLPLSCKKGYFAWAIGGNHNTKVLPTYKIVESCQKLKRPVILLGGPEDAGKGEEIAKACGDFVFNACGLYNINQSASLVKNAELVLTNDTGMMHAAAAFGKKIISFWGNTIPQFGMYPYMPGNENRSKIMEVNGLTCRPCSKIGYSKCPKKHFDCMNKIEPETIIDFVEVLNRPLKS